LITFDNVSKTFSSGVKAVCDLSMEIAEGQTVVLLGTSGSGKTTTLKMVNRLIEPTSGRILINGHNLMDQDPIQLRRTIGYAIQDIGLFPHMTVAENISLVPKLLNWPREKISERVATLLKMVDLEPERFIYRYPNQLSGGQQQRVGVARALAADPPIVLMDEPFGAIDPITREQLQNEFIELQAMIKKTVLFVTHDVFEAFKMGDQIALFHTGNLLQLAPPLELIKKPTSDLVRDFLGQHSFQLNLLTRTIDSILPDTLPSEKKMEEQQQIIYTTDSLLGALKRFQESKRRALPVYRGDQPLGLLDKARLLDAIIQTLDNN